MDGPAQLQCCLDRVSGPPETASASQCHSRVRGKTGRLRASSLALSPEHVVRVTPSRESCHCRDAISCDGPAVWDSIATAIGAITSAYGIQRPGFGPPVGCG